MVAKNKKKVKIGPSTYIKNEDLTLNKRKIVSNKKRTSINTKSRSLSPKNKTSNSLHWCPPPAKSSKSLKSPSQVDLMKTCRLNDFDTKMPINISPIKIPTCEVCTETRSRSRSKSPLVSDRLSSDRSNLNTNNNNNTSFTKRSCSSLSPVALNRSFEFIDQNATYTMTPRSRSHESILKCPNDEQPIKVVNDSELEMKRDFLINKLLDSESFASEILAQLSELKDFLKYETLDPSNVLHNSIAILKRFDKDRNNLFQLIDLFHLTNNDLKSVIYELTSTKGLSYLRNLQENKFLVKQINHLETENNVFFYLFIFCFVYLFLKVLFSF